MGEQDIFERISSRYFELTASERRADLVLQCGSREGPLQAGSVEARIAQLFVRGRQPGRSGWPRPWPGSTCDRGVAGTLAFD